MPTVIDGITQDDVNNRFESILFEENLREISPPDTHETIFDRKDVSPEQLYQAMKGIGRISVLGWSSQGPAHAQNLRDSISAIRDAGYEIDTEVVVGLQEGSKSRKLAEELGFTVVSTEEAAQTGDIVSMLISDGGQVDDGDRYIGLMKPGSTLLYAHGFHKGWRDHEEKPSYRDDINVVAVCPKGMGPSVRETYKIGSGINSSFAVVQEAENAEVSAIDRTLAYSAMIGSPYTFLTTLDSEWRSDIFGERAVLLGGVHGLVLGLAKEVMERNGGDAEAAYLEVVQSVVGPINDAILNGGFRGLIESLSPEDEEQFKAAYNSSYAGYRSIIDDIYEEVSSGREIAKVVGDNNNNKEFVDITKEDIWEATVEVRDGQRDAGFPYNIINPVAAGMYAAMMVAQVDKLREEGHHWSEAINESVIEAIASLNPYMKSGGIDYMVDNCSITARRGDRAWYEKFEQATKKAYEDFLAGKVEDLHYRRFINHKIHSAYELFDEYRPLGPDGKPLVISLEVSKEKLDAWRASKKAA